MKPSARITRESLLERAHRSAEEITMIFNDCDHWNSIRKPGEDAIDIDPDGALRKELDQVLAIIRQLEGIQ